jgi:hypothetical protein
MVGAFGSALIGIEIYQKEKSWNLIVEI